MSAIYAVFGGFIAILLCSGVVALTVWEILRFRRQKSLLTRGHVALRCLGALLLILLIAQVFLGLAFVRYVPDPGGETTSNATFFLAYWVACGFLTVVLFCILALDVFLLKRRQRQAQNELLRRQLFSHHPSNLN